MLLARKQKRIRFPILPLIIAGAAVVFVKSRSPEGRDQLERATIWISQTLDRTIGWPNLPKLLGTLVLVGDRMLLRRKNLYDTSAAPSIPIPPPVPEGTRYLTARTWFQDTYPAEQSAQVAYFSAE